MKALVLTGTKKMEIQDLPEPEVKPDEVLVNTIGGTLHLKICLF